MVVFIDRDWPEIEHESHRKDTNIYKLHFFVFFFCSAVRFGKYFPIVNLHLRAHYGLLLALRASSVR